MTTFSISRRIEDFEAEGITPRNEAEVLVTDRATRIPGYDLQVLQRLRVLMIGCGGLGGEIAHGLVRDGVRHLILCDHDRVELSNLNRQKFYKEDLDQSKALRLAHNLLREAVQPLSISAFAMTAQNALVHPRLGEINAVICGVDNDATRVDVARWALQMETPVIFTGVNVTADYGYVFVQSGRAEDPCFVCLYPDSIDETEPAPCDAGATVSILKTVAGPVIYALSAIFMPDLPWNWRYKEISLSGAVLDGNREILRRHGCPLCNPHLNFPPIDGRGD